MRVSKLQSVIGSRKAGFTIIELLAVIVLIGFLAAASGGFYRGTYQRMLLRKSARDFAVAAKYARLLAIERQGRCVIEMAEDRFGLYLDVLNEKSGQTEKVEVSDVYFRPVKFEGDIKFEDIRILSNEIASDENGGQAASIVFSADGTASASMVKIGDGRGSYTIVIAASTGKVKIYEDESEVVNSSIDLDAEQM